MDNQKIEGKSSIDFIKPLSHKGVTLEGIRFDIDELEQRLEMQIIDGSHQHEGICVWYTCSDVCPPGG